MGVTASMVVPHFAAFTEIPWYTWFGPLECSLWRISSLLCLLIRHCLYQPSWTTCL